MAEPDTAAKNVSSDDSDKEELVVAPTATGGGTHAAGKETSYLKTGLQQDLHMSNRPHPEGEEFDPATQSPGCGVIGRYPLISLLVAAVLGIGVGIGLNYWEPDSDNAEAKTELVRWLGLIGDIFIRALKCIVLPLVFFNVTLATVEMMTMGKASNIGWLTIGVYLFTTVMASVFGVIATLIFKSKYQEEVDLKMSYPANMTFACGSGSNTFLSEQEDGNVACVVDADVNDPMSTIFVVDDMNNMGFATASGPSRVPMGLSETFYTGIFWKLVSSNIVQSFASGELLAVVIFAIVFGVALGRLAIKKGPKNTTILDVFKECNILFIQIIIWIILLTPFAVFSLITSRLAKNDNLEKTVSNIGYLFAATLVGMAFQLALVHFTAFPLITKINPLQYLAHITPAMAMAFASSSSAATLPVTMSCVESTGRVPKTVSNFVLPLGATINMDGTAIYIPAAVVWLAYLNGHEVNAAQYIILILLGTIGSAGAAPVPSASLVLILSAYDTVFGGDGGVPYGFDFILAIDWLVDSFRTMLNVTGDAVVAAFVTHFAGLEGVEDPLDHDLVEEAEGDNKGENEASA